MTNKSSEFESWFGKSKVVDEQGNPRVMYHATTEDFDTFRPFSHFGPASAARARLQQWGKTKNEGVRTIPVYLKIENPLRLTDQEANGDHILHKAVQQGKYPELAKEWGMEPSTEALKRLGYDGIVYMNEGEGGGDSYIAFYPEQVRSAITKQAGIGVDKRNFYHGTSKQFDQLKPNDYGIIWLGDKRTAREYAEQDALFTPEPKKRLISVSVRRDARIIDLRDIHDPMTKRFWTRKSTYPRNEWAQHATHLILENNWAVPFLRENGVDGVIVSDSAGSAHQRHDSLAIINPDALSYQKRASSLPAKLYHGTSMSGIVGILKDNAINEGCHWGRPGEPHGIRLTKSRQVAETFAMEGLGGDEGAIIEFDAARLAKNYELEEYQDVNCRGDKWETDEQEVVVLSESISPVRKYITAIYLKNPFKDEQSRNEYAQLVEEEERMPAQVWLDGYAALLKDPLVHNSAKKTAASGRTYRLYHGTIGKFDQFEAGHSNGFTKQREGFYFTDDIRVAQEFGDGGVIIEADVTFQNPADLRDEHPNNPDFVAIWEKLTPEYQQQILDGKYWSRVTSCVSRGLAQTPEFIKATREATSTASSCKIAGVIWALTPISRLSRHRLRLRRKPPIDTRHRRTPPSPILNAMVGLRLMESSIRRSMKAITQLPRCSATMVIPLRIRPDGFVFLLITSSTVP
jgi:hypothetical protein